MLPDGSFNPGDLTSFDHAALDADAPEYNRDADLHVGPVLARNDLAGG